MSELCFIDTETFAVIVAERACPNYAPPAPMDDA